MYLCNVILDGKVSEGRSLACVAETQKDIVLMLY